MVDVPTWFHVVQLLSALLSMLGAFCAIMAMSTRGYKEPLPDHWVLPGFAFHSFGTMLSCFSYLYLDHIGVFS